jgi:hypothetical protein
MSLCEVGARSAELAGRRGLVVTDLGPRCVYYWAGVSVDFSMRLYVMASRASASASCCVVTVNDFYGFDQNAQVSLDLFVDIIGRNFKQPKEGLRYDNSPVGHMWRTIERPDAPL